MKVGIGSSLSILEVDRDPSEFYLMFLSREVDIKGVSGVEGVKGRGRVSPE